MVGQMLPGGFVQMACHWQGAQGLERGQGIGGGRVQNPTVGGLADTVIDFGQNGQHCLGKQQVGVFFPTADYLLGVEYDFDFLGAVLLDAR